MDAKSLSTDSLAESQPEISSRFSGDNSGGTNLLAVGGKREIEKSLIERGEDGVF
ncbi:hypothetical protein [Endozoicomonas sp. GU-1]|uniref:hypothetical protein n=1 Tax=Endozoicomonas sp. GU-1 TaxID=3009078 RepID=UPI0022B3408D|nr:hypothetical protein [Endozoicomonas sp. GU-1]WBA83538.1 hypothetical protein O2T12_10625 [Endozoicomonas sp. GU-1]